LFRTKRFSSATLLSNRLFFLSLTVNTRQLRLSDSEQIQKRIHEFIGKKINIVLQDMVILGQLQRVAPGDITLLNGRNKKVTVLTSAIIELFVDLPA